MYHPAINTQYIVFVVYFLACCAHVANKLVLCYQFGMPTRTFIKAPAKPEGRSRVGNGKDLLAGVDGRSAIMRRYKEIFGALVVDMGGDPSEARAIIARRASTLAVWCEAAEADLANGKDIDIAEFTTACNALRRLLTDLGLERKARDVTPTLKDYIGQNYGSAGA